MVVFFLLTCQTFLGDNELTSLMCEADSVERTFKVIMTSCGVNWVDVFVLLVCIVLIK